MRKRLKKKLARFCCPRCRGQTGVWYWYKLKTGRSVSMINWCYHCDISDDVKRRLDIEYGL
jgi:hypothetical protein